MLAVRHLSFYPVPPVIDPNINAVLERLAGQGANSIVTHKRQTLAIFRTFLDIGGLHLHTVGLEQSLPPLSRQFCGFLHDPKHGFRVPVRICGLMRTFQKLVGQACGELDITPPPLITMSSVSVTTDVEGCIPEYRKLNLDEARVAYYTGWFAHCNGGGKQFWNLSAFHEQYGLELTKQLWAATEDYCNKKIKTTARNSAGHLTSLLTTILQLYPTEADFKFAGTHHNINTTVFNIFSIQLIDTKQRGNCVKSFYKHWQYRVELIEKFFIKSGLWSKPPSPLWCPQFKTSPTNAGTHRHLDQEGNAFNNKLVTHIPLSYTDDQAIETLLDSIEKDIEHVTAACRKQADLTMLNFAKRKKLTALGVIKQPHVHSSSANTVDMKIEANRYATWEHYGYNCPVNSSYPNYLGVDGATATFVRNGGLLSPFTLYPFLYLLIEQHPAITDSWLTVFELYDKNGKASGFRQSGDSWLATSVKARRGSAKGQQTIILNETSKALFENIIALTEEARRHLKEKGDDSWRYLLLTCKSGLSTPCKINKLQPFGAGFLDNSPLRHAIAEQPVETDDERTERPLNNIARPSAEAYAKKGASILNNLSLTTFRASCGVRVYLQTRSVKVMSDALGHEKYDPKLLSSYLPEPILRYFQARWVRIFQNALVYEAMQDSDYLLEAMDFGEEELDAFLRNYKLKPLPEHVMTGQVDDLFEGGKVNGSSDANDASPSANAIIPVSTPMLQVMSRLVDLVEKAGSSQEITKTAANWYETSKFVLQSIDARNECPEIAKAMSDALANPLPAEKLKGAVYHVA
ncbi:hypothetical protein L4D76_01580 [Photobacterium sagamiensis]|uniref:hypothetical protein n=1 Tax=Photobacterium sagamiensis TaxID=2910241 RepID=UPI003D0E5D65